MGNRRVMFVDDDELIAAMTRATLRRVGHQPEVFSDPDAALDAFSRAPGDYDLVICDLRLGERSGLEVARRMRGISPAARILLVSGAVEESDEAAARDIGALGLLPKTDVMINLADVVARCAGP